MRRSRGGGLAARGRGSALCLLHLLAAAMLLACDPDGPAAGVPTQAAVRPSSSPAATLPPSPTLEPTVAPSRTPAPTDRAEPATVSATPRVGLRNQPGDYFERLVLRDAPRWFKVHVPPGYQPGVPMPLVFNLHGLGMNLEEQEKLTALSDKADEEGFVVVYPQAGASVWNIQAGEIGAIDVDFFRQMIDLLLERLSIDPERIYVTGFSNGGGMAHRLACDLSDRIAAIAPVAGAYLQDEICIPRRPVPILAIHGLDDRLAPFVDQSVGQDVPRWATIWAARNGCDREPQTEVEGRVTVETWQNCRNDATVILYRVEKMGHTWPGSPYGDRYGPGTWVLTANDLIWEFFQHHTLSGPQ